MPEDLSPWLALAGLGAFHGMNPAMGWLFAVALGLHRNSRRIVWLSLAPIALGHALSVASVVLLVVGFATLVDTRWIEIFGGLVLIGWAVWQFRYGHRHRVRIGMTTGLAGLGLWSFLMATAHSAGLMLVPVLIPLCGAGTPVRELTSSGSLQVALAAISLHTMAMLIVAGTIAALVYEVFGIAFLRKGWINLDLLWAIALLLAGMSLLA